MCTSAGHVFVSSRGSFGFGRGGFGPGHCAVWVRNGAYFGTPLELTARLSHTRCLEFGCGPELVCGGGCVEEIKPPNRLGQSHDQHGFLFFTPSPSYVRECCAKVCGAARVLPADRERCCEACGFFNSSERFTRGVSFTARCIILCN